MADQKQIDIAGISDLELAELITVQMTLLIQAQNNVSALQAELNRRKALVGEKCVE